LISKRSLFKIIGIMGLFLIAGFAIPVAANQNDTNQTGCKVAACKVALVISTAGLGDLSFNDLAFKALIEANDTYGPSGDGTMQAFTTADLGEPTDPLDIPALIEQFADDGSYDLIVAIGFTAADAVNASQIGHPTQKFVFLDGSADYSPNVATIAFREQEGSFLVGLLAGMTTTTNIVAFLGGGNFELINRFRAGFQQGVLAVNPTATVLNQYSPDATNPFGDLPGGKTVGLSFIEEGADIIYAAAGGTGLGVFDAVVETNEGNGISGTDTKASKPDKVYAIGVDSDQDYLQPGHILASMIKKVDTALFSQITNLVNDAFVGGLQSVGLKEGMVGISPMSDTTFERDVVFTPVGESRSAIIAAWGTFIEDGYVSVYAGPGVYEAVAAADAAPGFEGAIVLLGLSTLVVFALRRKKNK